MRKILHKYEVHPDFLRVLFSFGEEPHVAEASSDFLAIHAGESKDETCESTTVLNSRSRVTESISDITYQVNYVEDNLRKGQDKWSFRHTGVYHHHTPLLDLFIILHPNDHSVLEGRLLKMLEVDSAAKAKGSQFSAFREDPYRLHLLVMSSFFDNWRWYFRCLGEDFKAEVLIPLVLFGSYGLTTHIEQPCHGNQARRCRCPRKFPESQKFTKHERLRTLR